MDLDITEFPVAENGNEIIVLRFNYKEFTIENFTSLVAINVKDVID